MEKRIYLPLLAFLVTVSTVYGQDTFSDCLSPTGSNQFGGQDYQRKIDDILLKKLSNYQLLRYRQSETFWTIELDSINLKDPKFYLITHISPTKSIRRSLPETDDIEVKKITKYIRAEDYLLIKNLFSASLNSICAKCQNFGIDGTVYQFSDITMMGKVWLGKPPSSNLKKERLVLICQEINNLIIDVKGSEIQFQENLKNKIIGLTKDFEKQNANNP